MLSPSVSNLADVCEFVMFQVRFEPRKYVDVLLDEAHYCYGAITPCNRYKLRPKCVANSKGRRKMSDNSSRQHTTRPTLFFAALSVCARAVGACVRCVVGAQKKPRGAPVHATNQICDRRESVAREGKGEKSDTAACTTSSNANTN